MSFGDEYKNDFAPYSPELLSFLGQFVSEERMEKFERVLDERTRHITVVLEDIYQPHNASAVIRSCDCFGIQDLHIIENQFEFTISKKVVHGSSKWVDLHQYNEHENNTEQALNQLKSKGYRIVATSPHATMKISDLDLEKSKVALVFGTEQHGISEKVQEQADDLIQIPMYGFTESFNISVSAALCMQILAEKLRQIPISWGLSEQEKEEIKLDWVRKSVHRPDVLVKQFLSS